MKTTKNTPAKTKKGPTNDLGLPLLKPNRIIQKNLKVNFTPDEIKNFGGLLANTITAISELEGQKKSKMSEFKADIDKKKAESESLSNKISNGYEYTNIDCEVFLNMPNTGKKTIVRRDTNETVDVVDMTTEELQVEMDFDKAF